MARQVVEEISEVCDLDELVELLEESDKEAAYQRAKNKWRANHSISASEGLPGETVYFSGTGYRLVPFVHAWGYESEVTDFLEDSLAEEAGKGAELFVEQDLKDLFPGLEGLGVEEMNDLDEVKRKFPELYRESEKKEEELQEFIDFIEAEKGLFSRAIDSLSEILGFDIIENYFMPDELANLAGSTVDIEHFRRLGDQRSATTLPYHLEREYRWNKDPSMAVIAEEKSKIMADYLVENSTGDRAVALVGAGHYPHMVDILNSYSEGEEVEDSYPSQV